MKFPERLQLFFSPFSRLFIGTLFVFLSLPSFLMKTQRQDFQRTARVDEDGAILDSYAHFSAYYRAGIAIFILSLSVISCILIGVISIY